MKNTHAKLGYNDFFLRLIASLLAAHFIVAFGEKEKLFSLLIDPDYYRALAASFIIAFILVNIVYFITVRLDLHYDWKQLTVQRVILQFLIGLVAPSIFAFLLAYVYFKINGINILDTVYLQYDYPVINLLLVLLNFYYVGFYFYKQWRAEQVNQTNEVEKEAPKKVFVVNKGGKNIPLQVDNICYFYRDGNYNYLRTFDGESSLVSQPLDEIQQLVEEAAFFRANRQFLINYKACKYFEPLEYGKLQLFAEPSFKQPIIISQKRAKNFKEWMER